ncbi:glutathione reductase, putative, partial [Eimeria necatrix]
MAAAHHFDCVVLGGGSGGIAFARRAATYGAKVALVERSRMGGTCVNVGCVPKKIMWCAANAFESLHGMRHLGVEFSDPPRLNWQKLVQNRENYIKRLNRIYEDNLDKSQVRRFYGFATLNPQNHSDGQHVVLVNSSKEEAAKGAEPLQRLTAKHVLIATGGRPSPLGVPGGELCIDSAGFFALQQQPRKVGVVGGGYIAVELAAVLQSLGSETHFFCRQHAPLRKFDSMIQQQNLANMRRLGIQ